MFYFIAIGEPTESRDSSVFKTRDFSSVSGSGISLSFLANDAV